MPLVHPQFDPIAVQLGPLAIRWYGLMYLLAFGLFIYLGRRRAAQTERGWQAQEVDDVLFAGVLGVVIGGRLGYVLFYRLEHFLQHPLEIFAVWQGGMSFHGGFLGVAVALAWFAWRTKRSFWQVSDFVVPLVPTGLAAGRLGNFINGELWGRAADPSLPWAMIFPQADRLARHPSQLYQMLLEGLTLFVLLWWYSSRPRLDGRVSAFFMIGYGSFRFIAEYFREPDSVVVDLPLGITLGQWLSLPMVVAGIAVWVWAGRQSKRR